MSALAINPSILLGAINALKTAASWSVSIPTITLNVGTDTQAAPFITVSIQSEDEAGAFGSATDSQSCYVYFAFNVYLPRDGGEMSSDAISILQDLRTTFHHKSKQDTTNKCQIYFTRTGGVTLSDERRIWQVVETYRAFITQYATT